MATPVGSPSFVAEPGRSLREAGDARVRCDQAIKCAAFYGSPLPDAVRAARMISDSGARAFASLSRASSKLCAWLASSMACCTTPAFSNT